MTRESPIEAPPRCRPRSASRGTSAPAGAGPRRRWPLAALLLATSASVAANAMVLVLVPWLVLARTDSPAQAALVGAVSFAAAIPALLVGGPLIDRWGRRRVAVGADLLSAAAVAALPVLDLVVGLSIALTLALIAAGALFDAPGGAAREASRPALAVHSGYPTTTVNARGEASEEFGEIAGPALAGVGIGLIGAVSSLWVAAGLLVVAAAATYWSLPPDVPRARAGAGAWRDSVAGVRLLFGDAVLRAIALISVAAMLVAAPLTFVITVHAERAAAPVVLALVTSALAAGGIVGAVLYGVIGTRWRRRIVLVVALAMTTLGLGALATAMAFLPHPAVLAGIAAATGLAIGPINPVLAVTLQDRTRPEFLGRVVGAYWSVSLMAAPLGIAAVGALLEVAEPASAMAVIAAGLAIVAAAAASARSLRSIDPAGAALGAGTHHTTGRSVGVVRDSLNDT